MHWSTFLFVPDRYDCDANNEAVKMHLPFIVLVMTIILSTYAMRGRNALQRTTHAQ